MNNLDILRLERKKELGRIRAGHGGHSLVPANWGPFSEGISKPVPEILLSTYSKLYPTPSEMVSHWLEEDSSFISRGLPLFSPQGRIPYEGSDEWIYGGSEIIIQHLDRLVEHLNPSQAVNTQDLPEVCILDMGCGRGIALEDIAAYYCPVLNLRLEGDTLHAPGYQSAFAEQGIFLRVGYPSCGSGISRGLDFDSGQGYDLIMANRVIEYYLNRLWFAQFGRKRLSQYGIFPLNYDDLVTNTVILDRNNRAIADSKAYLDEQFMKMGWQIDKGSGMVIVKRCEKDELQLEFVPAQAAQTLPFFKENKDYYRMRAS